MSRSARRTRSLAEVERELGATIQARNALLDVLNAILAHEGGKMVVPTVEVLAATRHPIDVTEKGDHYVIELRGYQRTPRGIMARLGLARARA